MNVTTVTGQVPKKVESTLRQQLLRDMRAHGFHCHAVESWSVVAGIPDVDYCGHGQHGQVELKQVTVSSRPRAHLPVPLFKPEQRAYLVERARAGGIVYVVIQVVWMYEGAPSPKGVKDVFLCDGADAARHLGVDWTSEQLVEHARSMGQRRFTRAEIPPLLRGPSVVGVMRNKPTPGEPVSVVVGPAEVLLGDHAVVREVRESVGDVPGMKLQKQ